MANNVTDLGKVGITLKGEWSSATNYERLDAVTYEGSLYIAIKDNANVNPGANPTYWLLSAKHGEFTEQQLEDFKAEVVAESKEEMDDYTDDKKAELDTYEGTKETELNTYTGTKKTELDTYAGGLKDDFDSNASTKTTAFNDNATSKTTAFNTNATNKTTDFNDNATAKTTAFDTNATNKTNAFDDNASDKTDDFNDNVTAKTTAFDNNATAKTEAFDEHTAEIQADIEELQEEVSELSENMPWNTTGQDTEIQVTDAAKYSKNRLELFGNTEQDNTKMTYKCDGTETGDYYLTYNSIDYYFTMPTIVDGDILVFNTTDLKLYLEDTEITTESTGTGTNLTFISSPNPDYPQPIHVVTGENTIGVTGKNVLSLNNALRRVTSGVTFDANTYTDNTFRMTGKAIWGCETFVFDNSKTNTNYVISAKFKGSVSNNIRITAIGSDVLQYASPDLTTIGDSTVTSASANTSYNIATNFNSGSYKYLLIRFWNNASSTVLSDISDTLVSDIQLEESSIQTSFEPYTHRDYSLNLGSLELCKIGNYQDYLYKENGNWYKYKAINKGNFNALYRDRTVKVTSYIKPGLVAYACSVLPIKKIGGNNFEVFCENFSQKYLGSATDTTDTNSVRNSEGIASHTGNVDQLVISIDETRLSGTSVEDFFNYITNLNPQIAYILNTPTTTQITDEALIAQLDAIYEHLKLAKGTNNITVTASDLAPYIELTYMQDLPSKLDNLDSRLSLLE